jgi:hypothetical protein
LFDVEGFDRDGFKIVAGVTDPDTVGALIGALAQLTPEGAALERGGQVYASRNLLRDVPPVRSLAESVGLRALVEPVLGPGAFAVRGLLFDKTPEVNWMVPWHQDLSVAVKRRVDAPGFGPWLRVVPGSHRGGRLGPEATRHWLERVAPVACPVPVGGALVMRPLILHASSASNAPGHRRVVHIEYAADPLPFGVEWFESPLASGSLRS